MTGEPIDFTKWQSYARQILGDDFFTNFYLGVKNEGPQYDVYSNASEIIVLVNLPYVRDMSQIQLKVRETDLLLKGKIELGYEHMQEVHKGIFSGEFQSTIPLPQAVNTKRINAQYQRGLLIIQLFPRLSKGGKQVSIREI